MLYWRHARPFVSKKEKKKNLQISVKFCQKFSQNLQNFCGFLKILQKNFFFLFLVARQRCRKEKDQDFWSALKSKIFGCVKKWPFGMLAWVESKYVFLEKVDFLRNKSSFWRISGLFGKSQVFTGWAKKSTFRGVSEVCGKKLTFWGALKSRLFEVR